MTCRNSRGVLNGIRVAMVFWIGILFGAGTLAHANGIPVAEGFGSIAAIIGTSGLVILVLSSFIVLAHKCDPVCRDEWQR